MVSIVRSKSPIPDDGEPAWDIARLFPVQGQWDEAEYLSLDTNHLVEFSDGFIEVLAMPKPSHQRMVLYLVDELRRFVGAGKLGEVLVAPMRVRLRPGKFCEPDVMFMSKEHSARKGEDFWDGADLVVEVVSDDPESRERDLLRKRLDYAQAGIPEYWIVDPQEKRILVLTLHRGSYTEQIAECGFSAPSSLLPGFSVSVEGVFAAASGD